MDCQNLLGHYVNFSCLIEQIVRQHSHVLSTPKIEHIMLKRVMEKLDTNQIFPILAVFHSVESAIGCDNHYTNLALVRLISRKYLKLIIKKICRDRAL